MPRSARVHSSTGVYHITLRGVNRRKLFEEKEDFLYFSDALKRLQESHGTRLYACCLMDNHVHLLLKESEKGISRDMNTLCSSYAARYSRKYETDGYVFQDRFHSTPVEDKDYFYTCLQYICENPVKAGMVEQPFDYPWLWVCRALKSSVQRGQLCPSLAEARDVQNSPLVPLQSSIQASPLADDEVSHILCKFAGCPSVTDIPDLLESQKTAAVKAAVSSGASIRQIARLIGVSKSSIERLAKK